MKTEIGQTIKIKEGLYTVIRPHNQDGMFIARAAMMGYFITSFKMSFVEQDGILIQEDQIQLRNGVIIERR